ncbi:MAG: VapE domain-containing protein [Thauera sp.]
MNAPQNYASLGPKLLAQGFEPIPVFGKGRKPDGSSGMVPGWQDAVLHRDQIAYWAANGQGHLNVGLRTGTLAAVDLDLYDPAVAARVYEAFVARFGEAPCRIGRAPKRLLVYAAAEPRTKINSAVWLRPNPEEGEKENKVEVLGIGQQFVAYGIHPDTHKPYQWLNGSLEDQELWMLPTIDLDAVAAWVREELPTLIPADWTVKGSATAGAAWDDDPFEAVKNRHDDVDLEALRWMLDQLPQDYCDDRDSWRNVIFAAHHQFHGTEEALEALEIVDVWSSKSVKYVTGVVPAIWEEAHEQRAGGLITVGSLKDWVGLDNWAAYRAQRKAAASAAVVQERDWFARIASADQVEIEGPISAEIRAADVSSTQREQLAQAISRRFANLGRPTGIAAARRLVAAPRAVLARPGDVDLKEFIPYGLPVPALSPAAFPHCTMTENTISLKNTMENTQRLLEAYGITVFYDVIRKKASLRLPGLEVCPDQADNAALSWVTSLAALNDLNGEKAAEYAVTTAFQRPRNTVADWIKSKPWDGKDRVAQLCNTLTVRPGFPQSLRDLVVRRWLISAVAAAMKTAGFYSKGVLVLQGPQSIGKTPWVANLLPDAFADYVHLGMHLDPSNRDSVKTAVSHWIVELGEVDSTMNRADVAMLKAFISQRTDKVRLPYARVDSEFPRRTVFFASVNPEEFLRDDTGNVRWWTVPVTAVDYEHGLDLQQLWAQVAAAYEEGERWWLVREEEAQLEACNAGHVVRSAIHDMLASVLDMTAPKTEWKRLSASGVLKLLGVKTPTNPQSKDAAAALKMLVGDKCGYTNGSPCWWVPPLKFENRGSDLLEG